MKQKQGLTRLGVEALDNCRVGFTPKHSVMYISRRRWQDFFRLTTWFVCYKCDEMWMEYKP